VAPTDTCTYPPADFFLANLNNGMVPVNVFLKRIIVESKIPFQIRIFVSSAGMHRALAGFFCGVSGRVSDPYSFDTDPYPDRAF
jgi:hypothetical protein